MSQPAWRTEIQDLIRGASGGFLFGIPLLYTMEVWWVGSYTSPPLMLTVFAVTFVVIFLLARTDGFRRISSDTLLQSLMDSIEILAIGILCATCILILLREVNDSTPLDEALGKIVFESIPFSFGVALSRSLLSGSRFSSEDDEEPPQGDRPAKSQQPLQQTSYNATLADIGATLVGTVIIAFNIAPTDEVPMLAAAISAPWLLVLIATSLLVSYGIVFVADFTAQSKRLQQQGIFQDPLVETAIAYLIALVAAASMLWFFHRLSVSDPWTLWLKHTLIMGLPAAVGGAAGRLAV